MTKQLSREYHKHFVVDPDLYMDISKYQPYVYSEEQSDATIERYRQMGRIYLAVMLNGEPIGSTRLHVVTPDTLYFTTGNINAYFGEAAVLPLAALYGRKPVAISPEDVRFEVSEMRRNSGEFFLQLCEVDHQTRHQRLAGVFRRNGKTAGETKRNLDLLLIHMHGSGESHHVIDRAFSHTNGAGDCCADDICAGLSVTAVTADGESGDSFILGEKFASCHRINYRATLVISTLV